MIHLWRSDNAKKKDLGLLGVVKCWKVSRWEKLMEGKGYLNLVTRIPLMPSLGCKSLEFSGDEE